MKCSCGNQACQVRERRGLVAFCQMPPPASRPAAGFDTYAEAAGARQADQRIRSVGGVLSGFPVRFVLV